MKESCLWSIFLALLICLRVSATSQKNDTQSDENVSAVIRFLSDVVDELGNFKKDTTPQGRFMYGMLQNIIKKPSNGNEESQIRPQDAANQKLNNNYIATAHHNDKAPHLGLNLHLVDNNHEVKTDEPAHNFNNVGSKTWRTWTPALKPSAVDNEPVDYSYLREHKPPELGSNSSPDQYLNTHDLVFHGAQNQPSNSHESQGVKSNGSRRPVTSDPSSISPWQKNLKNKLTIDTGKHSQNHEIESHRDQSHGSRWSVLPDTTLDMDYLDDKYLTDHASKHKQIHNFGDRELKHYEVNDVGSVPEKGSVLPNADNHHREEQTSNYQGHPTKLIRPYDSLHKLESPDTPELPLGHPTKLIRPYDSLHNLESPDAPELPLGVSTKIIRPYDSVHKLESPDTSELPLGHPIPQGPYVSTHNLQSPDQSEPPLVRPVLLGPSVPVNYLKSPFPPASDLDHSTSQLTSFSDQYHFNDNPPSYEDHSASQLSSFSDQHNLNDNPPPYIDDAGITDHMAELIKYMGKLKANNEDYIDIAGIIDKIRKGQFTVVESLKKLIHDVFGYDVATIKEEDARSIMRLVLDIVDFLLGKTKSKPPSYPVPVAQYRNLPVPQQSAPPIDVIKGAFEVMKPVLKLPPSHQL